MKSARAPYASEAEMCAEFCAHAETRGYTAYAETAGWDVLLVRKADGFQIGVQAKLRLNAAVLKQAVDDYWMAWTGVGPDCRAVLVPRIGTAGLEALAPHLGVTILVANGPGKLTRSGATLRVGSYETPPVSPALPLISKARGVPDAEGAHWFELCPLKRTPLPEYVPDVAAGSSAPLQLTDWKIRAIKIAVLLEERGHVTRRDFKDLSIDVRRWLTMGWLKADDGVLKRGAMPDFRAQHPRVFEEIAADIDKWRPKALAEAHA